MAKKQIIPTPEQIRKAYIEEHLKRNPNAEEFASFSENELVAFIRKYEKGDFGSIYECTDHHFYDRIRKRIGPDDDMRQEDDAVGQKYSVHLKNYSDFLGSKAFKKLFKHKINIEGETVSTSSTYTTTTSTHESSVPKFRLETEGERKHIMKEMDVVYRNPKLRQECLDKFGYQCQCCGMDFAEIYGEALGANFIEVHHLKPISTFEKDGVPENFVDNLVPLCSNCHSMIHHISDSEHTLRDLREAYKGPKKELKIIKED